MSFISKMDTGIYYLLLLYALASSLSIAAANIAISLAILLAIIRYSKEPITVTCDKGLITAIAVFLFAVLIAAVFAYNPIDGLNRMLNHLYRILPLFLAIMFIKNQEQLMKVLIVMGISIFISDSYAIWQGVHGNYRANAFGAHPMILAGCLIQMIPLLVVLGLDSKKISINKQIYFLSVGAISLIALLYNGTRGAWIAVVVVFLLYGILNIKQNKKIMIVFLAGCLFAGILAMNVPVIKDRIDSITDMTNQSNLERVLLWKSSWRMFLDNPLVGIGPGNFSAAYKSNYILPEATEPYLEHAHNNFVQMLAETGIIGISSFVYMFGYILFTMYRKYILNRHNIWALATFLVTSSLLVQGLTEYNFGNSVVIRMYWFIVGLMYAAMHIYSSSSE